VRRWFDNTLVSRLNHKRSGAIISIQQRLHEDDLPAYLLEKGYDSLILPAIAEKDEGIAVGGGRYYHRRVGDLLNPERENDEDLARIRREMGPQAFSAQYQQNPVLPEGNLVRIEWFGRVDELPEREECLMIVQSWDTGMSDNPSSDPSVCLPGDGIRSAGTSSTCCASGLAIPISAAQCFVRKAAGVQIMS